MSNVQLTQFITPRKMARYGQLLKGVITVSKMKRTEGLLASKIGNIMVNLQFAIDDKGLSVVLGDLQGEVVMHCRRCMGQVPIEVKTKIALACVYTDDQVRSLPDCYEPLVTQEERVDLYQLIEDELLLSLPIVAYHPDPTCIIDSEYEYTNKEVDTVKKLLVTPISPEGETSDSPFSVLAQLKSRN